jgi:hypothetical protein
MPVRDQQLQEWFFDMQSYVYRIRPLFGISLIHTRIGMPDGSAEMTGNWPIKKEPPWQEVQQIFLFLADITPTVGAGKCRNGLKYLGYNMME